MQGWRTHTPHLQPSPDSPASALVASNQPHLTRVTRRGTGRCGGPAAQTTGARPAQRACYQPWCRRAAPSRWPPRLRRQARSRAGRGLPLQQPALRCWRLHGPRVGVSCRPECRVQVGGARVRVGRKGGVPAAPLDSRAGWRPGPCPPPGPPSGSNTPSWQHSRAPMRRGAARSAASAIRSISPLTSAGQGGSGHSQLRAGRMQDAGRGGEAPAGGAAYTSIDGARQLLSEAGPGTAPRT